MAIPQSDAEFSTFSFNAVAYINNNNVGKWDFPASTMDPLNNANTTWLSAYPAHLAGQQTAKSLRQAKQDARYLKPTGLDPVLRNVLQMIAPHPNTTNADRAALDIPIPGTPGSPPPPLASYPEPMIKRILPGEITVAWVDSVSGKKAKPTGVVGADIYMAITDQGAPMPPIESFVFQSHDTDSPYTKEFESTDAGKVAHFTLQWVRTDSTTSAHCPPISITIV